MTHALAGGSAAAVAAALLGWFMVLRRESFAGHTLSLMAFPGAAGALLAGLPATAGYFIFTLAGALGIVALPGSREPGGEGLAIATVQAVGLGLGLLFLSLYGGVLGGYESLLFGDFLGISHGQVITLIAIAVGVAVLLVACGRPLLFASVDGRVASAAGVPVRRLDAAFLVLLGVTVAAVAQITGALLVFALLVAPAASAQLLTARVPLSFALSLAGALLVTWGGLLLAFYSELPTGFTITMLALALYVAARLLAWRRS
jgi:zinc/manganese transport system permease protein